MKHQIIGKNIEVTPGIEAAVKKKLGKMDKYFIITDDVTCRTVVRSYKTGAKVEVTIFTKMMNFRAEVTDKDLYAAVDVAIDKLEGQMRRLKTRLDRRNGGQGLGESIVIENIEDDTEKPFNDQIVRIKSIYLTPMSVEEAITRMTALGHEFFVYLDEEDNLVSVLYRRIDGGFGIIQAENKIYQ